MKLPVEAYAVTTDAGDFLAIERRNRRGPSTVLILPPPTTNALRLKISSAVRQLRLKDQARRKATLP
jgi:hypothetical protein